MPKEPDRLINNKVFVDKVKDKWVKIYNYLTFAGFQKEALYSSFDKRFGKDTWFPAHSFDGKIVSRLEGYLIYEEAYYEYLKNNPRIKEWITYTASEVYDIQPSNVDCGLDYTIQECGATHLQDISVRRVLTRLKLEETGITYDPAGLPRISIFKGDHLVQIRGKDSEGFILNPGQVPFHKPELALGSYRKNWWKENSVEDIYQRNKVLLVEPKQLLLYMSMLTKNSIYLSLDKNTYFRFAPDEDPMGLHYVPGKEVRRKAQEKTLQDYCEVKQPPWGHFPQLAQMSNEILNKKPRLGAKKATYDEICEIMDRNTREAQ